MNHLPLFDATLLAITLPSILLCGLIAITARDHRCFPWQRAERSPFSSEPRELAATSLLRILKCFATESAVYVTTLSFAALLYSWYSSQLSWEFLIDSHMNWLMRFIIPRTMNILLSTCISFPIIVVLQMLLLKSGTKKSLRAVICSGQFFFCVMVLTASIAPVLALEQWNSALHGTSFENLKATRELFRCCVALSTLPISLCAIPIAFSVQSVDKKELERISLALRNNDCSSLVSKSDGELHVLVNMAVKAKKLDLADKISKQLLHQIEHPTLIL